MNKANTIIILHFGLTKIYMVLIGMQNAVSIFSGNIFNFKRQGRQRKSGAYEFGIE